MLHSAQYNTGNSRPQQVTYEIVITRATTMRTIQKSASKTTVNQDGILKNVQVIHRKSRKEKQRNEGQNTEVKNK